eukprot:TRINITY_DN17606_c0_g4_i1.p1 TRINITY_DN17606_c0_g4~~TRINITY_DN17606_c0_g4_i1.p1  ORF type:complete len:290 (+),score=41.47 TRINITY_DN17606_c0_g4_i1:49-870(+)
MYESYLDVLYALYDAVSIGGYVICEDCRCIRESDRAVTGFRQHHRLWGPMKEVPGSRCGSFWRKDVEVLTDAGSYMTWVKTRHERAHCHGSFVATTAEAAGVDERCSDKDFAERLALLSLEAKPISSLTELESYCEEDPGGHTFVWGLQLSANPQEFNRDQRLAIYGLQEGLMPEPRLFCSRVLLVDFSKPVSSDLAHRLEEAEPLTWKSDVQIYMNFSVVCGPGVIAVRQMLQKVFHAFDVRPERLQHIASQPSFIRNLVMESSACWSMPPD